MDLYFIYVYSTAVLSYAYVRKQQNRSYMELCLSKLDFYNCATDMNQITTLELFNYHFII